MFMYFEPFSLRVHYTRMYQAAIRTGTQVAMMLLVAVTLTVVIIQVLASTSKY